MAKVSQIRVRQTTNSGCFAYQPRQWKRNTEDFEGFPHLFEEVKTICLISRGTTATGRISTFVSFCPLSCRRAMGSHALSIRPVNGTANRWVVKSKHIWKTNLNVVTEQICIFDGTIAENVSLNFGRLSRAGRTTSLLFAALLLLFVRSRVFFLLAFASHSVKLYCIAENPSHANCRSHRNRPNFKLR